MDNQELLSLFGEEIEQLKSEIREDAELQIKAQVPVSSGKLLSTVNVEWQGDELVATSDTDYDSYVRHGYVSDLGNIVPGNDYFDIDLEV